MPNRLPSPTFMAAGSVVVAGMLLAVTAAAAAVGMNGLQTTACDHGHIYVVSGNVEDTGIACDGAAAARDFLSGQGLDVSRDIKVQIVPGLGNHVRDNAAGCYLASEDTVLVLNYAAFEKIGSWCGVATDRSFYRALVAHEAAHAIAACNFKIPQPSLTAHEYIAYVTMMATMDAAKRQSVMLHFPGTGYETDQAINTTIYLCNPMRFGVQAYRHFLKLDDPGAYLDAILSGRALRD